jgi:uncharacterized RDD family membrane protein YckC
MTQPAPVQIAPISRRAVGFLIDAFIAAGVAIVLFGGLVVAATVGGSEAVAATLLIGGGAVVLLLLAWFVVYTAMQAGRGSIGMRVQRIRLVRAADDMPLGFGRALLRNIVFGLAGAIVVGYFTPLFDGSDRFQGWHDKAAGSLMVDASAKGSDASRAGTAAPMSPDASTIVPTSQIPQAPRAETPRPGAPAPSGIPQPVAPARPAPAVPVDESALIAFVPGFTPAPATPRAPADVPRAAPAAEDAGAEPDVAAALDATVQGYGPLRSAAPAPVPAPVESTPPAAEELDDTRISIPGHRLVFTWDDGTRVSVSRRTIFGRNPAAEDGAVVVPVRDETLSLSKTHFEAASESSGGWVLDRHSTNGMTLVRDGRRIACPPGQRVPVRLGDAIEIGDRIVTVGGYA